MKKLIFTAVLAFSCLLFKNANAQIHLSLGVNIGAQPEWAPAGYDHADYYYLPDVNAYYDVAAHLFVVNDGQGWHHVEHLPNANYDLYHSYKVVLNEREPWRHNDVVRAKYAQYRGRHDQVIIRDSHDDKYRNHWHGDDGYDRDHRHDHDKH